MNRRRFALATAVTCVTPVVVSSRLGIRPDSSANFEPQVFEFGKDAEVDLKSVPAQWNGGDVHLLELAKINFAIVSATNQLRAEVRGALKTFDNVDYQVGVVVFDEKGNMLGAANANCKVPRIWLGVYASQPVKLDFDFGTSRSFPKASKFLVSISDEEVLTPDKWQK